MAFLCGTLLMVALGAYVFSMFEIQSIIEVCGQHTDELNCMYVVEHTGLVYTAQKKCLNWQLGQELNLEKLFPKRIDSTFEMSPQNILCATVAQHGLYIKGQLWKCENREGKMNCWEVETPRTLWARMED